MLYILYTPFFAAPKAAPAAPTGVKAPAAKPSKAVATAAAADTVADVKAAVWQCKTDKGWADYDDSICAVIETGYQHRQTLVAAGGSSVAKTAFSFRGVAYEADLQATPMLQRRVDGK